MMFQIWKQLIIGVAWGGIVTFIALTILVITNTDSSVTTIWLYMGGSLFLGIYFSFAAYIFIIEQWSPLKKTIVHFCLSLTVYFIVAFSIGWVPVNTFAIVISTLIFMLTYILFWIGFNLYYRNEIDTLNESLDKHNK